MEVKKYFKEFRKKLSVLKKIIYITFKKMIYIAGVGVFVMIFLCGAIWGVSYKARQQRQHRLASFSHFLCGARYCREKQYNKGIKEFQKAIGINPGRGNAVAYYGLAYAYRELGQYEKSIEYYRIVVELNPYDARAYVELGLVLDKQQQQQSPKEVKETIGETIQKWFPNPYKDKKRE